MKIINMFKALYRDEIDAIYNKYHHLLNLHELTEGEELSNRIKDKFPQNLNDIKFCVNHIAFIYKTYSYFYFVAKN